MDNDFEPVVGNWYAHVDDGRTFVVLAVDEDKNVVEVRHEDGEIEELDLAEWPDLDLELTEPPEGWEDTVGEDLEAGELGLEEAGDAWQAPGGRARPRSGKSWEDDHEEDEDEEDLDDWGEESEDY